jgi:glycosyltransferase involved in cell wall biosynthesis
MASTGPGIVANMSDKNGLVSVVIPVYNGERFLGRTLSSALAQTYRPLEIIVVDDGSADRTEEIAETAANKDGRIRYFRRRNYGVAESRNFGIKNAKGDLIAPLDHDDLWSPNKISRQVRLMNDSPAEVGVVYCLALEIDQNDLVIPPIRRLQRKRIAKGRVTNDLALGCFIETSSAPLIKKSFIEKIGGYDTELRPQGAEDWKLYFALSEICEFAVIPEFLVGYRQVSGSLSRNLVRMDQSMEAVGSWIFERHPDLPPELKAMMIYYCSIFMAQRSLDNDEFRLALGYTGRAYKSYPRGLLEPPLRKFLARLLVRLVGVRREKLRRRGLVSRISFHEFQAQQAFDGPYT